jgi:hypothetical protein
MANPEVNSPDGESIAFNDAAVSESRQNLRVEATLIP